MTDDLALVERPRADALRLGFTAPAAEWVEATPVGNGRTGAMVFGGRSGTRLQLNDSSVWSGTPTAGSRALDELVAGGAGPERLAEVRAAIDRGDYREAERLLYSFEGPWSQEFLPLGELVVTELPDARSAVPGDAEVAGSYARELDLDDAIVRERAGVDGSRTTRTVWASAPAGCVLVHLSYDVPTDVELAVSTPLRLERASAGAGAASGAEAAAGVGEGAGDRSGAASVALGVRLPVDGAPLHEEQVAEPLVYRDERDAGAAEYDPYAAIAVAVHSDGVATAAGTGIRLTGVRRALVAIATDSTGRRWWQGDGSDLTAAARPALIADTLRLAERAAATAPAELLAAHLDDVRPLLGASTLRIGARRAGLFDVARDVLHSDDDALTATVLTQFGRYLLVAASRPGSPPANLQGIWNDRLRPPWSSNYTININTEMNYWAAESSGLGVCHGPLLDLIDRLSVTGAETARRLYGTRGWVAHHNTDPWGYSLPVGAGHGNPSWAIWMMGGLWLTDHLWQHWRYSLDERFLRERAWPVLVGAAEFALDWLVDDVPAEGAVGSVGGSGSGPGLRTIPSTSPENLFRGPDGRAESLAQSSTMDISLIRALFGRVTEAAGMLGLEHPVLAEIAAALPRLVGFTATADGRLREWGADLVEVDPDHRHMSQMIAVHPLGLIDPVSTPELAKAAVATLDRRGPGAMGWSWAWKIALRARLGDGETARELLREASAPFERDHRRLAPVDGSEWGGLLPNLFSTHPPVQLDGNFGFAAAVRELVLGTAEGAVRLLPALPGAWADGELLGARLPGALAVDLRWAGGQPVEVVVRRLAEASPRAVEVELRGRRMRVPLDADETVLDLSELVPAGAGLR
ncbi:glycosyl hydrolase family 95 catalytic domain-containing protein [Herbiconiux flava]|uniref:Alpha-L-fucosidase 2 n=1 Tax=Herbiconiux flava TaxID=881268 RepID=A0A852SL11_9MICO|nr:glycoside hydrolase N-terminal domain-containing protein [Herbiconiux flava]NYD69291.1 alpha-L-fucosidase 2 [Herbiconiux flava]GLK16037.1 alpha/beta hydrolase [Herbiconiux flava]